MLLKIIKYCWTTTCQNQAKISLCFTWSYLDLSETISWSFPSAELFPQLCSSALMLKWNDCIPPALLSRIIGNYLFLTYAGNLVKHNSNSVTSDELFLQNTALQCSSPLPISLAVLIQISEVLCAAHCFLSLSSVLQKFFCCVTLNSFPTFFETLATLHWLKKKTEMILSSASLVPWLKLAV